VRAITVHVVDYDVVTAGHCNTVILIDHSAVANCGVVGRSQAKSCKPAFSRAK